MRTAMDRSRSHAISCGTRSSAAGAPGFEMMPAVLMMAMQQKLLIAFGAEDRALHKVSIESELSHGSGHTIAGSAVQFRIAHDPPLPYLPLPHFELRFH